MSHAVHNAQTDVGKPHSGNVLAQSHAFAALGGVLDSTAQVLGNQADSLQMEHIGDRAGALGDVTLDGVRQRIHTGGCSQALGHGGHHVRIDDSDFEDPGRYCKPLHPSPMQAVL